jgi:hypothetical protein
MDWDFSFHKDGIMILFGFFLSICGVLLNRLVEYGDPVVPWTQIELPR